MTHHVLTDPIPRVIRQMAVPVSVGMFFQTMYNVVDTYFAGQLSSEALAALSITFPVFFMVMAFGFGLSQATTVLVGVELGRRDLDRAEETARQSFTYATLLSVVLTLVGVLGARPALILLGATGSYLVLAERYLMVLMLGAGFFVVQGVANGLLSSRGQTTPYRNVLVASFLANLALDPLLVFGAGLGVQGLAYSTVTAQGVGCAYLVWRARAAVGSAPWIRWWPHRGFMVEISRQAGPASFAMLTVAGGIFVITYFVSGFGPQSVAAYGVATRVEQIVLLPSMGLTSAMLALASQSFGAGDTGRALASWHTTLRYGLLMMFIAGAALYLAAPLSIAPFTPDPTIRTLGTTYLRYAALALPAYPALFITTALLQGIKRPAFSMYIGIFRQLLAPTMAFPVLSHLLGLEGIWLGVVGIVWFSALLSIGVAHLTLAERPC